MIPIDPVSLRDFLEATVVAFSMLGGVMAYVSGYMAARALAENQSPDVLAQRINEGIGQGFNWGSLAAWSALIIMV